MQCDTFEKTDLWPEYRRAFREFCRKLRRAQSLATLSNPDPEELFTASLELEEARTNYNVQRDALVRQILSSQGGNPRQ